MIRHAILVLALLCVAASSAHATTYVANINNALGWAKSYTYSLGADANAGPGYSPTGSPGGGTYTSGSVLYGWRVTACGSPCTSAASGSGPAISGSCAASTAVTDGGVTWRCLSQVDYLTITDWLGDAVPWAPNTTYYEGNVVGANGREYLMDVNPTAGTYSACSTSSPSGCQCESASSGSGPSGTSFPISDGTCIWWNAGRGWYDSEVEDLYYGAKIFTPTYSSQRTVGGVPVFPTTLDITPTSCTSHSCAGGNTMSGPVEADLWNSREYSEANGEVFPLYFQFHTGGLSSEDTSWNFSYDNYLTLRPAVGESFPENALVRSNALAYNQANGVGIHMANASVSGNTFGCSTCAIYSRDYMVFVNNLQVKSDHMMTVLGLGGVSMSADILDGATTTVYMDGTPNLVNSLVIVRGQLGIRWNYGGVMVNDTFVCPSGTSPQCLLAIDNYNPTYNDEGYTWRLPNHAAVNIAIFGFQYTGAWDQAAPPNSAWSTENGGNVTDNANTSFDTTIDLTSSGAGPDVCGSTCPLTTYPVAGTTANEPFTTATFVNTATDFRTVSGSSLIGAGVTSVTPPADWPLVSSGQSMYAQYPSFFTPQPWSTPDISLLARPQMGNTDAGAWQSGATVLFGGGRLLR